MNRCFICGERMFKKDMVVHEGFGTGPKVDILVPGEECSHCKHRTFSGMAAKIIEDDAYQALIAQEVNPCLISKTSPYNAPGTAAQAY